MPNPAAAENRRSAPFPAFARPPPLKPTARPTKTPVARRRTTTSCWNSTNWGAGTSWTTTTNCCCSTTRNWMTTVAGARNSTGWRTRATTTRAEATRRKEN
jgi:hypothetical protein